MRRKIYKSLTAILLASTMITGVVQTPITSYASQNIRWIKDDAGNTIDLNEGHVELTYDLNDYITLACRWKLFDGLL